MQLTRTRSEGQFYCPTCSRDTDYRFRASRPFLTVYFIPVVPVGGINEFVQCRTCRGTFEPSVLEVAREALVEQSAERFKDEVLKAMMLVVIADDTISEAEIEGLQQLSHRLLERPADRDTLGLVCSSLQQTRMTTLNYIRSVSRHWNHDQRVLALQAMFLAASIEGELSANQLRALRKQMKELDLTEQEFQAAIEEVIAFDD